MNITNITTSLARPTGEGATSGWNWAEEGQRAWIATAENLGVRITAEDHDVAGEYECGRVLADGCWYVLQYRQDEVRALPSAITVKTYTAADDERAGVIVAHDGKRYIVTGIETQTEYGRTEYGNAAAELVGRALVSYGELDGEPTGTADWSATVAQGQAILSDLGAHRDELVLEMMRRANLDVLAMIDDATAERANARRLADAFEEHWRTAIRMAFLAGANRDEIAARAGVSRERVYQINDGRR